MLLVQAIAVNLDWASLTELDFSVGLLSGANVSLARKMPLMPQWDPALGAEPNLASK